MGLTGAMGGAHQLSFGHGMHFRMGAHLSSPEVGTMVNHPLDSAERVELAGPVAWTTTPSLSGPASVPPRIVRGPS